MGAVNGDNAHSIRQKDLEAAPAAQVEHQHACRNSAELDETRRTEDSGDVTDRT
jgi:hypothetical protein